MTWDEAKDRAVSALDDHGRTGLGIVERVGLALMQAAGSSDIELAMIRAAEYDRRGPKEE